MPEPALDELIGQLAQKQHGYTIPPSTARFRTTPADVTAFLANSSPTEIKSAC
jgi:hypothetical protein